MSDSVQPHRWQPTRLLRPWDSPGKNTGVGCHFLLQCMHACTLSSFGRLQLCETLWTAVHQAPLSTGFSRQEYWSGLPFFLLSLKCLFHPALRNCCQVNGEIMEIAITRQQTLGSPDAKFMNFVVNMTLRGQDASKHLEEFS